MDFILKAPLQDRLSNVWETAGTVSNTQRQVPLSIAMNDEANSALLEGKLLSENGQKMSVELIWDLPECAPAAAGCLTGCEVGADPTGQDSETYSITCNNTNTFKKGFEFDYEDFKNAAALMSSLPVLDAPLTESKVRGTSIEGKMLEAISLVDKAHEKRIGQYLYDSVNSTTYGFSPKEIGDIPNLATDFGKAVKTFGQISATQFNELLTEVKYSADKAMYRNPILIGGYLLDQYRMLNSAACCSSAGYDLSSIFNANKIPFLQSDALAEVYNTELGLTSLKNMPYFLSYDVGSIQVVNYAQYRGMFEVTNPMFTRTTIVSPFSGRAMDIEFSLTACGKKINMWVSATEELYLRPETQCVGDYAHTVNGLQQFVIKNS